MTQAEQIFMYMKTHGTITTIQASKELDITKLPTRIGEMKRSGIAINTEIVHDVNKHGTPTRYARYSLAE